jgi:integrase
MKTKLSLKTPNAENSAIWIVLSDGRDVHIRVYTGISIKSRHWSKKNDCVLSANPDAGSLNTFLKDIQKQVTDLYLTAKGSGIQPDSKYIRLKLDQIKGDGLEKAKATCTDLLGYVDVYVESRRNEVKKRTFDSYSVYKKRLETFEVQRRKKLLITDVDSKLKSEFESFCNAQKYSSSTAGRTMKFIKSVSLHAKSNGLATSHQMESIRVKPTRSDSVYLTTEELDRIASLEFTSEGLHAKGSTEFTAEELDNARDWLLISCQTGQRYSDFIRFNDRMVRVENGKSLIEFTQVKTEKIMTVPLSQKAMAVLKKRDGNFPNPVPDYRYNDQIREVCRLAGIAQLVSGSRMQETKQGSRIYRKVFGTYEKWMLVSSHIGRRSFASNFYGLIPTTYLTYITGHKTETMFLQYIGKSNKDLALEISRYF